MRELIYAMRFTGQAEPVGNVGNVLTAATSAPSSTLSSSVGPNGLTGTLAPAPSAGYTLRFATVGSGHLAPSADPQKKHGTVMWRVDGGEGQFADATGLITSNIFVDETFGVVDHHVGVLLLP